MISLLSPDQRPFTMLTKRRALAGCRTFTFTNMIFPRRLSVVFGAAMASAFGVFLVSPEFVAKAFGPFLLAI
jgi:hypothetical protein